MIGPMTAGEVRVIRTKLGLTQAEFAKKVGVATNTVTRWEGGHARHSGECGPVDEAPGETTSPEALTWDAHNLLAVKIVETSDPSGDRWAKALAVLAAVGQSDA